MNKIERRFLTAVFLALAGCSLSAPSKDELFSPSTGSDASTRRDSAAADAAVPVEDAGQDEDIDSGSVADTGTLPAKDASNATDAGADAGATAFNPQAGLLVHYRFNETSGDVVHDFSGSTKDALVVGAPGGFEQWISAGRVDGALKLSGDKTDAGTGHYVELPQGILLGLEETSIALWMNRQGGPLWQRVFDLGSGQGVWLYFTPTGATSLPVVAGLTSGHIFVDFLQITDAPTGEGLLKINQTIPVGTWTHVVITWSKSEIRFHLNGKLAAQTVTHGMVAPSDLGNTTQNFIGRSQFAPDPFYNGLIDEFRIYNRVLSASDVQSLFEAQ